MFECFLFDVGVGGNLGVLNVSSLVVFSLH